MSLNFLMVQAKILRWLKSIIQKDKNLKPYHKRYSLTCRFFVNFKLQKIKAHV